MATFDEKYKERLIDIISNGISNEGSEVRTVWKDGTPAYTKSLWVRTMRFTPEEGFPILKSKYVNFKSAAAEILWIKQKASNVIKDAQELGTNVWNEWESEDSTIGKSYGYQIANNTFRVYIENLSEKAKVAMGKTIDEGEGSDYYSYLDEKDREYVELNQVDYVIHQLIDNPASRQTVTTLMNPKEHHEMGLPPCVWAAHYEVLGGKLQLSVLARSSDTFLGYPFNVSQYALQHRLIAQVTGYEIGDFVITTEDTHLYDRHIEIAMEQLNREVPEGPEPTLWIDETVESYQDFKYGENFYLIGYNEEEGHAGKLPAPIAISPKELKRLREKGEIK